MRYGGGIRTNVVLDDELVREAFGLTGVRTEKDLILLALEELIRVRRKKDAPYPPPSAESSGRFFLEVEV